MMLTLDGRKKFRSTLLACAMAVTATGAFLPVVPAVAQVRALPDFTDLVDQVGPAVVNIRTVERVAQRGGSGGAANGEMDQEMQEFLRRFFGQNMPNMPGAPRQEFAQPLQHLGRPHQMTPGQRQQPVEVAPHVEARTLLGREGQHEVRAHELQHRRLLETGRRQSLPAQRHGRHVDPGTLDHRTTSS